MKTINEIDAEILELETGIRQTDDDAIEERIKRLQYERKIETADKLYLNFKSFSDVIPYEVLERNEKTCKIRRMECLPKKDCDYMSNQWDYFSDETRSIIIVRATKKDPYMFKLPNVNQYAYLDTEPYHYYDYSF